MADKDLDFVALASKRKLKSRDIVAAMSVISGNQTEISRALESVSNTQKTMVEDLATMSAAQQAHVEQFNTHVEEDVAARNKLKGAWKVLLWALGVLQLFTLTAGSIFWADYVTKAERLTAVEKTQAAQLALYPIRKATKIEK
jgi:hypothetical protein